MRERTQFNLAQRWRELLRGTPRKKRKKGDLVVLTGVLGIIILASPWISGFYLDRQLDGVKVRMARQEKVAQAVRAKEEAEAQLAQQEQFIQRVNDQKMDPEALLGKIFTLLPPGTKVSSFAIQDKKTIQLNVVLEGPVDVAQLWTSFRDSDLFVDFDLKTVSLKDEIQSLSLNLQLK